MVPLAIFILFILVIETYSFVGFKGALLSEEKKALIYIYASTSLITLLGMFLMYRAAAGGYSHMQTHENILFGLAFSFILAKFMISTIFLIEDLMRGFIWLFQSAANFRMVEMTSRSFLSGILASGVGIIIVLLMNYGVLFGRYHFKTHHQIIEYENLPDAFNGFKIAQLSDMHLGTFDQKKQVEKGLSQLQAEHPDLIVFTGDLVNNLAEEATPFIDIMKKLQAPYGKYSILGNHDYADYVQWESKNAKNQNIERLKNIEQKMGFQLLNNEHIALTKGKDSIYLAGVENWGTPPFPQHGELNKALKNLKSNDFIVLLSHDPTHWREKVIPSPTHVELTLSGHTHGMQFGIEIGNFKWSPVKYRYSDWAGLFTKNGINLYVNRGFGCIGYPGRVGIWPEITIIELRKKAKNNEN
jgi:predicted MPP superfamily phosphohydrolase